MKTLALALVPCFALSTSAFAQIGDDDPIPVSEDAGGDEVEMGPDDAPPVPFSDEGSPTGAEEDPGAPTLDKVLGADVDPAGAASSNGLVARPLTLASGQLQLRYRAGFGGLNEKIAYSYGGNDELVRFGGVLTAEYGITDVVQLGLHYGTGTLGTVVSDAGNEDRGYSTGKTVAIEVRYRIEDWVAIQVEVPIHVEPIEAALTIGAPMRFRFGDRLAVFVLEDLLTIAFDDFVPITDDATSNEAAVSALGSNEILPDGDITIKGGVIYQRSPKMALKGTFGIIAPDFSMDDDPGVPLIGELFYSMSERMDLYGSAGIYNLADASSTLHFGGGVSFRL